MGSLYLCIESHDSSRPLVKTRWPRGYNDGVGTLYLVATPIGNLEDITLRGLRTLERVALIAAEDTRTTRKLLGSYGITTPTTSYHEHTSRSKAAGLLKTLETSDIALVSEAGTPGISDPGKVLVQMALEAGFQVMPIPGASAPASALSVSGLPSDQYLFLGFLPRRKTERTKLLTSVADMPFTLVAFEAPHRLRASLSDLLDVLGDREVAVSREMTKRHEEVFKGLLSGAIDHFPEPRGEFTLVVAGAGPSNKPGDGPDEEALREEVIRLQGMGMGAREAADTIAKSTGLSRREAYKRWLEVIGKKVQP